MGYVINDLTGSIRGSDGLPMSSIERDVYDGNLSTAALAHASRVATADPGRSLVKITIEDKC